MKLGDILVERGVTIRGTKVTVKKRRDLESIIKAKMRRDPKPQPPKKPIKQANPKQVSNKGLFAAEMERLLVIKTRQDKVIETKNRRRKKEPLSSALPPFSYDEVMSMLSIHELRKLQIKSNFFNIIYGDK